MKKLVACLAFLIYFNTAFTQQRFIPFSDPHLQYQGRIPLAKDAAIFCWPGTSVDIDFEGTGLSAEFMDSDTSNYYNIIIDHDKIYKTHFDTVRKSYLLAHELAQGKHHIQVFKITEWDKGRTYFYGFKLPASAKILSPEPLPERKITFYGNSITCGYAIEDKYKDSAAGYYENNYDAYGAITARHFHAQYQCIAKSGIGIMVSWFPLIMPEMFDRLDPEDPDSHWDFSKYQPNVVVINLLQNDSWIVNNPNHPEFKRRFPNGKPDEHTIVHAYQDFVSSIRKHHPDSQIICMMGNMDITRKDSPWPDFMKKAVQQLHDPKIYTLVVPFKETPGHPKVAEQKVLADYLIRFIDEHIRWNI